MAAVAAMAREQPVLAVLLAALVMSVAVPGDGRMQMKPELQIEEHDDCTPDVVLAPVVGNKSASLGPLQACRVLHGACRGIVLHRVMAGLWH